MIVARGSELYFIPLKLPVFVTKLNLKELSVFPFFDTAGSYPEV